MARAFVIVTAAAREQGPLVECLRQTAGARPILFATPAGIQLEEPPALILVDLDALEDEGVAAVRAFHVHWPEVPLVAVGSAVDEPTIDTALRAGALAYVPNAYSDNQKLLVLRLALEGVGHRPHFARQEASPEPDSETGAAPESSLRSRKLTPKQVEVLSLAAEGLSNRQIAGRLGIAEGTVKLHMSAIYTKLEVDRRGEAIVVARRLREVRAEQMRHAEGGARVLDWLLPHVTHKRAARGETIFRKGDLGSGLYYVQRGTVALEEIGVELGPRQILGEIGVFSPEHTRTCTARCVTDVDLFCLDSEQVKSIYYLNPQFALHVVQLIAQRLLADRDRTR
jgi:DNA-binding NarL/FixJ family response regulator